MSLPCLLNDNSAKRCNEIIKSLGTNDGWILIDERTVKVPPKRLWAGNLAFYTRKFGNFHVLIGKSMFSSYQQQDNVIKRAPLYFYSSKSRGENLWCLGS